jgi:hypothetical protein
MPRTIRDGVLLAAGVVLTCLGLSSVYGREYTGDPSR